MYDFDLGNDNGRYQFLLDVDDDSHIQKTVGLDSLVTYYVPAGTHNLIIDQDTAQGAEWDVVVSLNTVGDNTLP